MLTFLHTAPLHVETFSALVRELGQSIPVRHEVRPDLLATALAAGVASDVVRSGVSDVLEELARDGARVLLCTCSTLGGLAESIVLPHCIVMRVDRAVAEHAISSGRRILLVAALPTALQQTMALLRQVASVTRRSPEIIEVLCPQAWGFFEAGDNSSYLAEVVKAITLTAVSGDLVLLAQASMAPAAELLARTELMVVSSPRLGVAAAVSAYRSLEPASPDGGSQ